MLVRILAGHFAQDKSSLVSCDNIFILLHHCQAMDVEGDEAEEVEEGKSEGEAAEGLEQKAFLLRLVHGDVLTGKLNTNGNAEWDWSRVAHTLQMQTEKDHLLLKRGNEEFEDEFRVAQVSFDEFHYRGRQNEEGMHGHSMESRALWLMLSLLPMRRQVRAKVKSNAIALLKSLMDAMLVLVAGVAHVSLSFNGTIYGTDCQYHSSNVSFSMQGISEGIAGLLQYHSGVASVWSRLSSAAWCGYKISSTLKRATILDVLVFLMYAKSHQHSSVEMWRDIGVFLWPQVLFMLGNALEVCANVLANKATEAAPLLKTRSGGTRRVPLVNKWLLLRKMKNSKSHRKLVMSSHGDLVPSNTQLVKSEPLLEVSEYLKLLEATFSKCHHFQVSWDPSTYAGDEVLVATVFSVEAGTTAYLPIQFMNPVASSELSDELRVLAGKKSLTRVAGYCELRGLSHALKGIQKGLGDLKLPEAMKWKALSNDEYRELDGGQYFVVTKGTLERVPQIPQGFSIYNQCLLVSITDQGKVNLGALDYIVYHLGLTVLAGYDRQHRTYNDLKAALKFAGLYKAFLSWAMIFNLNYSPMGSKTWFLKKKDCLKNFMEDNNPHSEPWLSYMPLVCSERLETETGSPEQRVKMFEAMRGMKSCQILGPLAKLMRWYSWWESNEFYSGECWMTRCLMLHGKTTDLDEDSLDASFAVPEGLTPKEELKQLKMKHGGWKLAPALITKASMWEKTAIAELGKPLWTHYTEMTKNVKTPEDIGSQIVFFIKTEFVFFCFVVLVMVTLFRLMVQSNPGIRMFRITLCKWLWVDGKMNC